MASQESVQPEWFSITVFIKCECGQDLALSGPDPYEERACYYSCGRTYHVSAQLVRKAP